MDERLSKSKYLAGRQCLKRLWLICHAPELAEPPDPGSLALFETGTDIGRHAHALFPGGVLVADRSRHDEAVACTQALLRAPNVPAIFEAAFVHDGVRIRVDVLERLDDGWWGLREVKSTTQVKDVHLDDVAIQRYVLEGAGLRVGSVEVIHVDNTYVRGDGEIEWGRFFVRRDVSPEAATRLPRVPALVRAMHETVDQPDAPPIEPAPHCWNPYGCEFWGHCTGDKPSDWILHLPQLRSARLEALREAGIERITEIPEDFPLLALQTRVRDVLRSGRAFIAPELGVALAGFGPPADYLDFETMNPAIPLYTGARPYERIPFQWSLHRADAQGGCTHAEFLADGRTDPRRAFATSLLKEVRGSTTPVLVYSSFEASVLTELAAALPDLAAELEALRARLGDLYALVSRHVYHPAFGFSFSLKSVAPALVPGISYRDLEGISEGAAASEAFHLLAAGRSEPKEEARVRHALLAYCERDTLALVELHRALWDCARRSDRQGRSEW
jgi:hypothetical protein